MQRPHVNFQLGLTVVLLRRINISTTLLDQQLRCFEFRWRAWKRWCNRDESRKALRCHDVRNSKPT